MLFADPALKLPARGIAKLSFYLSKYFLENELAAAAPSASIIQHFAGYASRFRLRDRIGLNIRIVTTLLRLA